MKNILTGIGLLGLFVWLVAAGGGPLHNPQEELAFTAESVPGTTASAVGTDAIAIGDGAIAGNAAGDNSAVAIGASAIATGNASIAIGMNTDATGDGSIAIGGNSTDGSSADASGFESISIGLLSNATQNDAISIGTNAQSTAARSIAMGQGADATGANCIAIGGNQTGTDSADCSAADAIALGQHILADDIGEFAFASGEFSVQSDAHTSIFVLRNNTTDGTQTELFADGSAGDISVPSDCTNLARISIVARQTDEDGTNAMYFIVVGHGNDAGTTAELAAPTVTTIFESANASSWVVDTTADDTNDGINVLVTGAVGDAVQWVARVEVVETCG